MKKIFKYASIALLLLMMFAPFLSSAQTTDKTRSTGTNKTMASNSPMVVCSQNVEDIGDILCKMGLVLKAVIPLLIALGVVYFVWGVVQYVIGGSDEDKKKGRDRIIFGIIGLAVIMSLWGLVSIVINTFGIKGSTIDISGLTSTFNEVDDGSACDLMPNPKLQNLLSYITCIIAKSVIPLIFVLATVMFTWGVVQYVINDAEEAKEKGKNFMIWGIIALTVMVSVWGLVAIVGRTFNVNTGVIPQLKQ